jgi:hypothetical protein
LDRRLGGSQSHSGCRGEGKKIPSLREQNGLRMLKNKALRRIFGPKRE